ncbi:hypothetical protein BDV23DRAFT_181468 [Aspergillus alliaceus]|uniref:Uncharacterized protein n=1 Tax=Petromyces alliaceus TaxID=209559 RepID=A0A5N7CF89_PETAA|nr:hypothetical protein BDV23DRAFT_181468 [Aspergillus alliaceus]
MDRALLSPRWKSGPRVMASFRAIIRIIYHNGETSGMIGLNFHGHHVLKLKKGEVITSWVTKNKTFGLVWLRNTKENVSLAVSCFGESMSPFGKDPTKSNDVLRAVVYPIFITDISKITRKLVITKMPDDRLINLVEFGPAHTDNPGSDTEASQGHHPDEVNHRCGPNSPIPAR